MKHSAVQYIKRSVVSTRFRPTNIILKKCSTHNTNGRMVKEKKTLRKLYMHCANALSFRCDATRKFSEGNAEGIQDRPYLSSQAVQSHRVMFFLYFFFFSTHSLFVGSLSFSRFLSLSVQFLLFLWINTCFCRSVLCKSPALAKKRPSLLSTARISREYVFIIWLDFILVQIHKIRKKKKYMNLWICVCVCATLMPIKMCTSVMLFCQIGISAATREIERPFWMLEKKSNLQCKVIDYNWYIERCSIWVRVYYSVPICFSTTTVDAYAYLCSGILGASVKRIIQKFTEVKLVIDS